MVTITLGCVEVAKVELMLLASPSPYGGLVPVYMQVLRRYGGAVVGNRSLKRKRVREASKKNKEKKVVL